MTCHINTDDGHLSPRRGCCVVYGHKLVKGVKDGCNAGVKDGCKWWGKSSWHN